MIVEYIRYKVPENRSNEFESAYQKAKVPLLKSEHCKHYEITRCTEDQELYTVRIEWTSIKDHMEGFRKSEEFQEFFIHVRPFFEQIQEMQHYKIL